MRNRFPFRILDLRPKHSMTMLRARQIWEPFHTDPKTMTFLGYQNAETLEAWITINAIRIVDTDDAVRIRR